MSGMTRNSSLADKLDGIPMSLREIASAKARMEKAEMIADAMLDIAAAVTGTVRLVQHVAQATVRRVRDVFMRPAHH